MRKKEKAQNLGSFKQYPRYTFCIVTPSAWLWWAAGLGNQHRLFYLISAFPMERKTSSSCQTPFHNTSALPTDATHHQPPPCSKSQRRPVVRSPRVITRRSAFRHQNNTHWLAKAGRACFASHDQPGTLLRETLLSSAAAWLLQLKVMSAKPLFAEQEFQRDQKTFTEGQPKSPSHVIR